MHLYPWLSDVALSIRPSVRSEVISIVVARSSTTTITQTKRSPERGAVRLSKASQSPPSHFADASARPLFRESNASATSRRRNEGNRRVKLLLARRPADPARRINGISQFSSVRERAGEPSVVAASGALPAVNTLTIFTAAGPLASDR